MIPLLLLLAQPQVLRLCLLLFLFPVHHKAGLALRHVKKSQLYHLLRCDYHHHHQQQQQQPLSRHNNDESDPTYCHTRLLGQQRNADNDSNAAVTAYDDDDPQQRLRLLQTPHAGRHFLPSHPAYHHHRSTASMTPSYKKDLRRTLFSSVSLFFFRLMRGRYAQRFMEGWYFRLTLPPGETMIMTSPSTEKSKNFIATAATSAASFAVIVSIEDPGKLPEWRNWNRLGRTDPDNNNYHIDEMENQKRDLRLVCIQMVGPNDSYLVQADPDETKLWAARTVQALGCVFQFCHHHSNNDSGDGFNETSSMRRHHREKHSPQPLSRIHEERLPLLILNDTADVESGFQIVLPQHMWGRIRGHDGSMGGVLSGQGVPGSCDFHWTVNPLVGWGGNASHPQRSTAGWLSYFRVFEPHWQVTMADGRASGSILWQNLTYTFVDAPFYAEKNWGAALPSKWYWTQCNSFDGYKHKQLSVTAGGGIRTIPFGRKEKIGMLSIHYNHDFYEGVPWLGSMEWRVAPWGSWELSGFFPHAERPFEAIITYTCDPDQTPGLKFRAPTPDEGMVYFCRDTFDADVSLTLWELRWNTDTKQFERKPGRPLLDNVTSTQGGAEIGGGPWWDEWRGTSRVRQPIRTLLQLPRRMQTMRRKLFSQRP